MENKRKVWIFGISIIVLFGIVYLVFLSAMKKKTGQSEQFWCIYLTFDIVNLNNKANRISSTLLHDGDAILFLPSFTHLSQDQASIISMSQSHLSFFKISFILAFYHHTVHLLRTFLSWGFFLFQPQPFLIGLA